MSRFIVARPGHGLKPVAICPCEVSALAAAILMLGDNWYIAEISETHVLKFTWSDGGSRIAWIPRRYTLDNDDLAAIADYEAYRNTLHRT